MWFFPAASGVIPKAGSISRKLFSCARTGLEGVLAIFFSNDLEAIDDAPYLCVRFLKHGFGTSKTNWSFAFYCDQNFKIICWLSNSYLSLQPLFE